MTTEKALGRVFKKNPVPNGKENRVYKKVRVKKFEYSLLITVLDTQNGRIEKTGYT